MFAEHSYAGPENQHNITMDETIKLTLMGWEWTGVVLNFGINGKDHFLSSHPQNKNKNTILIVPKIIN